MDIIQFAEQHIALGLLVFTRISGIFVSAPIFSSRNIPARMRVLMAMAIALVVLPAVLQKQSVAVPSTLASYVVCVFLELFLGVCVGLLLALFFAVIQVAGQMIDQKVGFGIVNVVDPQSGIQVPLLGNFLQMIFTLVFFAADFHHLFLIALIDSFSTLPLMQAVITPGLAVYMVDLFAGMFTFAFKLAMPLIMVTLLVDVSMGMLARTMPQLNVFVLGIPLKLAVGIFMLSVFLPTYVYILKVAYAEVPKNINQLLSAFTN